MNREGADAALFGDALACEETRRSTFLPQPVDAVLAEAACLRAEASLRAIAVIEDAGGDEEDAAQSPALRRIEARLDLLMTLLGTLAQRSQTDPLVSLRWSAVGACLPTRAALAEGSTGLFRIQAALWLPEPLELPATVIACEPGQAVWLRFGPLTEAATSALERHLFRQHRRAIAERRTTRQP